MSEIESDEYTESESEEEILNTVNVFDSDDKPIKLGVNKRKISAGASNTTEPEAADEEGTKKKRGPRGIHQLSCQFSLTSS